MLRPTQDERDKPDRDSIFDHSGLVIVLILALIGLTILACGCNERPTTPVKSVKPKTVTIEDAANLYLVNYAANSALAAAKTAEKCRKGEFRDVTEADEFFSEMTKEARLHANVPFAEALTKALADQKGKPAKDVAPVYDKVAEGFGRIGGVSFKSKTTAKKVMP